MIPLYKLKVSKLLVKLKSQNDCSQQCKKIRNNRELLLSLQLQAKITIVLTWLYKVDLKNLNFKNKRTCFHSHQILLPMQIHKKLLTMERKEVLIIKNTKIIKNRKSFKFKKWLNIKCQLIKIRMMSSLSITILIKLLLVQVLS